MENEKGKYRSFAKGILVGSFLGALTGILVAPKAGKELRSEFKQKGSEAFEEAERVYSDSRTKAKAILDEAKYRADQLRKEADRQLSEARQKVKEILGGAEEKASQVMASAEGPTEEKREELKS
jgi:gas vesicle protein